MPKYSNIRCASCYNKLTEKAANDYPFTWRTGQVGGDMYCMRCRPCPDDCRKEPCREITRQEGELRDHSVSAWHKRYVLFPNITTNGKRYITECQVCQDNETGRCYVRLLNKEIRVCHAFFHDGQTSYYCNTRDRYAFYLDFVSK